MGAPQALLFLSALLLVAVSIQPVVRRLHIPLNAALVAIGFCASELVVMAGRDTGIRADSFHDLILYVFLPILIFESAFKIDPRQLLGNLLPILILAIPLLLLSALLTAVLVYAGIAHPEGFPWIAALLTGALLAATDPASVVAALRDAGVSERLVILLEGESLLNDATAIVLFGLFLAIATGSGDPLTWTEASRHFLVVFFGGILAGAATGLLMTAIFKLLAEPVKQALVTVISAYLAYILAESLLHVSGVMAVLVTGLVLGRIKAAGVFVRELWELNAWLANALVFLLVGVTITPDMFTERWLAMLIGIAGILTARAIGIFGGVPLVSRLPGVEPIHRREQVVMFWGSLRGAVALALALSLPTSLDYWWTIQAIVFGAVLFTMFVQAPVTTLLLKRFRRD